MSILMKLFVTFASLVCFSTPSEALDVANSGEHPIEGVINMLEKLKAESMAQGKKEAVMYAEFTEWCSTGIGELQDAIAEEKEHISELNDELDGRGKELKNLGDDIDSLVEQIGDIDVTAQNRTVDDDNRAQRYAEKLEALDDTIGAIQEALVQMKRAETDTEKMLLAQKQASQVLALISVDSSVSVDDIDKLQALADPDKNSGRAIVARRLEETPEEARRKSFDRDMADRRDKFREKMEDRQAASAKKNARREGNLRWKEQEQMYSGSEGDLKDHVDKYDFKSENVIELLMELQRKFTDDKVATVKAETDRRNAHDIASKSREAEKQAAEASAKKKREEKGRVQKIFDQKTIFLENEESDLKKDSKNLLDTQEACSIKREEWEDRSKVREAELKAMDDAISIIAKVSGVRTEAPGNPIPPASPVLERGGWTGDKDLSDNFKHGGSFLQFGSESNPESNPKMSAVLLLHKAAEKTHSKALERLAVQLNAHLKGPFDSVNNMIEKMIFRLMDEQKQEDEHMLWCKHELKETTEMNDTKTERIEDLQADIEVEQGKVGVLNTDIEKADNMTSDLVAFMEEATNIRQTGKKENALAVKDAQEAQRALENAIAVLNTFYKQTGKVEKKSWEFLQAKEEPEADPTPAGPTREEQMYAKDPVSLDPSPGSWKNDPYKGVGEPGEEGGIIQLLEKVMADFAEMEAKTKSQEAMDQQEYEQAMHDSKEEKQRREKEAEMKRNERSTRSTNIDELMGRKKDTTAERDTTNQYLKDLRPACVDGDSSYEDRKEARTTEIEALQKAQAILTDHGVDHKVYKEGEDHSAQKGLDAAKKFNEEQKRKQRNRAREAQFRPSFLEIRRHDSFM